ncbi:MAG: hypothetical protein NT065_01290 [Chlamydiae bacterium]|nr:hypothetical protein [Chlamydiota bacterium]
MEHRVLNWNVSKNLDTYFKTEALARNKMLRRNKTLSIIAMML